MLFEQFPERYHRARPPYPEQLWELLARFNLAREGSRVLDLGAGTGHATGPLLERGARVDAVEPGPGLASLLKERFPAAGVQVARAEDADYPPGAYDGVVAATSLHWMDLEVVLPRIHQSLRPKGWFIPFWHVFFDPRAEPTPFREAVNAMFGAPPTIEGTPLDEDSWRHRLTRAGLFRIHSVHVWRWTHRMTSQQLHDLVSTFNGWTPAHITTATTAVDRLGGEVVEHYTTIAYVCMPVRQSADRMSPR